MEMCLYPRGRSFSKQLVAGLLMVLIVSSGLGISQVPAWAARTSESESDTLAFKPYMRFDEPKPKIPKEILSDARLDQKVKVFVKSKNFKQLFAELSKKTGVKLGTTREISGERAIIYFHKRPLRDVMTEISGLYGYHWLVKGEPGEYKYELFEDIRHAKRRDEARDEQKEAQGALLAEAVSRVAEALENEELSNRLAQGGPKVDELTSGRSKDFVSMLSKLGPGVLRSMLADESKAWSFADFPAQWQAAVCDWRNRLNQRRIQTAQAWGEEAPPVTTYTPADSRSASVQFGLATTGTGMFEFPRLCMTITTDQQGSWTAMWPPWGLDKSGLYALIPEAAPSRGLGQDQPLPDEPKVTVPAGRQRFPNGKAIPALVIGDFLQAIAEQSGRDVIADYYFQQDFPSPANEEPLGKLAARLCDQLDYTCQAQDSTLRFRFNKWFVQPLPQEPPAKLVETLWQEIEETGVLGLDEIASIAYLRDEQMQWAGFRFMPGANVARRWPTTLRLWGLIGSELASLAWREEGLPISRLTPEQQDYVSYWADLLKADVSPNVLAQSVITISVSPVPDIMGISAVLGRMETVRRSQGGEEGRQGYSFALRLPDGSSPGAYVTMPRTLSKEDRRKLADQRRADMEADVIEVLE